MYLCYSLSILSYSNIIQFHFILLLEENINLHCLVTIPKVIILYLFNHIFNFIVPVAGSGALPFNSRLNIEKVILNL